MRSLYMLSISNPDLTDKIYWCLFYDPLNFIWAHIHVLFMAMKTYFHRPLQKREGTGASFLY